MENHQRNVGGNTRIIETMTRYFRFPSDFEKMVFLSQVTAGPRHQDGHRVLALHQAALHGHALLADQRHLPVASWSSLDYGGGWKLLHYMAKRFFLPINVVAVPSESGIELRAINDTPDKSVIGLEVLAVNALGGY